MSQRTRYFLIGSAFVMVLGLGVGAVAYYNGNLPLKSTAGPEEFAYLPASVNGVAYGNVGAVMRSQFTEKLRQVLPTGEEKAKLQEVLGLDIERDIDSVVAGATGPGHEGGIVLVRGRFNQGHLEALALQHGGVAEDYKGKKLIVSGGSERDPVLGRHPFATLAFLEGDLIAFGDRSSLERAIDAKLSGESVTKNAEMMRLIGEVQAGSDSWIVGSSALTAETR